MSEFEVGQQVVCIDDYFRPGAHRYCTAFPRRNQLYTVRAVGRVPNPEGELGLGLRLVEIVNPPAINVRFPGECWWCDWRFRPLRTEEIEVFLRMCRAIRTKVLEKV